MGPPVNHGAFLIPARSGPDWSGRTARIFSVLSDRDRFEEVNTYSDCLTRHFNDSLGCISRRTGAVSKEMNVDLASLPNSVPHSLNY
jgi:hypothetical protein